MRLLLNKKSNLDDVAEALELKLDNEGETHWYTPMNKEKIKLHMPHLCTPNIDCKKIGNPLTFYNRKRRLMKKDNENRQVEENGD